jgi:hypothetical protein
MKNCKGEFAFAVGCLFLLGRDAVARLWLRVARDHRRGSIEHVVALEYSVADQHSVADYHPVAQTVLSA